MAKSPINKSYKITAKGILVIEDKKVMIENVDTGEAINLSDLFIDFSDKDVSIVITYNEDYE